MPSLAARLSTLVDRLRDMRAAIALLWEYLTHPAQRGLPAPRRVVRLTPTELVVARLVCEGLTTPQIAERLTVEAATVKSHRRHINSKLKANTPAGLIAKRGEWDDSMGAYKDTYPAPLQKNK